MITHAFKTCGRGQTTKNYFGHGPQKGYKAHHWMNNRVMKGQFFLANSLRAGNKMKLFNLKRIFCQICNCSKITWLETPFCASRLVKLFLIFYRPEDHCPMRTALITFFPTKYSALPKDSSIQYGQPMYTCCRWKSTMVVLCSEKGIFKKRIFSMTSCVASHI